MTELLLPHQVTGVEWMLRRETSKPSGGLLCDEMGLGKTIQMIYVMKRNPKHRTLIVVPKSLVKQWKSEFEKFDPSCTLCVYDGSKRVFDPSCSVTVCPYSVIADLLGEEWDRVILDEGHEIRNSSSLVHKNCMKLKSRTRWILTGTPVFNNVRDFVSLCSFIRIERNRVLAYLDAIKAEYVLRRLKSDIIPCVFENVELSMYEDEKRLYETVYDQFILSGGENILEGILRCRQMCAWPQLCIDGMTEKDGIERTPWKGSTAKFDYLIKSVSKHESEKTIVFTQFRGEALEIKRLLENQGHTVFVLDGQTKNRDETIQNFKNGPNGSIFVIQIKAGGVGLNLQEATRIYIMQPSWNLATELQAIARAHRNGQTKTVYVKKLVYSDADVVETELVELENAKLRLYSKITGDEGNVKIPKLFSGTSNFAVKLGKLLYDST